MTYALVPLLVLPAAAGLFYYYRLASRLPSPAPKLNDFGVGDAVLTGLLGLWFASLIAESFGRKVEVNANVILFSITLYFGIISILLAFLAVRGKNPVELLGLRWIGWPLGLLRTLGSLLAAYPLIFSALLLTQLAGIKGESQDVVQYVQTATNMGDRLLVILMAVIVAPIAEETIFRGYMHGVLKKYGGRWCGVVVNSMFFAAIHGHAPSLAGLFVLAVALTLVYERMGSLWAPIFMHATFNTVTVTVALLWPEVLK